MLLLINTNRMSPPIGPIGLEYVASAVKAAGIDAQVLDLCLCQDPVQHLRAALGRCQPELVGLSFRNIDDCFWPSAQSFVPSLAEWVGRVRELTDAPIVVGGVGFSVFAAGILQRSGADLGIRGDGELAIVELLRQLRAHRQFQHVPGLLWRDGASQQLVQNEPAWPAELSIPTARDCIDNAAYFRLGGQGGFETKRGCGRACSYCADAIAKGSHLRLRQPAEAAQEVACLLGQGVDVLHTCDSEFNLAAEHAMVVCQELIDRGLGRRVRWYAYCSVLPFPAELAELMARAGCVGINFTADSANDAMLASYRQPHRQADIATAVKLCRRHGLASMLDLLLGGPGETPASVEETIDFVRRIDADAAGASLGIRLHPQTGITRAICAQGPLEANPGLRRRYDGPVDFVQPTFYISPALGSHPARLVKELIAGDQRFFEPAEEAPAGQGLSDPISPGREPVDRAHGRPGAAEPGKVTDHNYNDNTPLAQAIAAGARGAYWHILRLMRG